MATSICGSHILNIAGIALDDIARDETENYFGLCICSWSSCMALL